MITGLSVDGTILLGKNEKMLSRTVSEFDRMCKRIKLKISVGRSKVIVFERVKDQPLNFAMPERLKMK